MMDAPVYAPASAYRVPHAVAAPVTTASVSLAEILATPAAWAIVVEHAPIMKMIVAGPQIKPFLTNMMVESFITYGGIVKREQIDAMDAEFRQLPVGTWAALL